MADDATGEFTRAELIIIERAVSREVARLQRRHEQLGSAERKTVPVAMAQLENKIFRLRLARDRQAASQ